MASSPVSDRPDNPVCSAQDMNPPVRLMLDERVGHLLRRAYQRHMTIFQQHMNEFNLTPPQFITLAHLFEHGNCSQSDLGRLTAIDHTTIRGIINRLKARGLLNTESDPEDARKVTTVLTPKGKEITKQALSRIDDVSELTLNGINEVERVALFHLLRRLADIQ